MTEKKRVVRCSICKESGHNKKTCKSKNKNIGIWLKWLQIFVFVGIAIFILV